jgi:hypothetical protein
MGPNERELLKVLNASYTAVTNAHKAWESGRSALDTVKSELHNGIEGLKEELGGKTREAAIAKFDSMRTRVEDHQASLVLGRDALSIAATAIDKAQKDYNSLPGIIPEPGKLPTDASDADTIVYAKRQANASKSVSDRETAAGTALTSLNTSLDTSISKMREARGDAPPDDRSSGSGGTTTKTGTYTPYTGGKRLTYTDPRPPGNGQGIDYPVPTDPNHPGYPEHPPSYPPNDPYNPPHHPYTPPDSPYDPSHPTGPGGYDPTYPGTGTDDGSLIPGGLTGGLTGGLIGTSSVVGGIRGLSGLRGLTSGLAGEVSSTGRMSGGMIGRSGAMGGGAGGRAGSRAGGRGGRAGAGMGGRNANKRKGKNKGKAADHLVEEDAWLDDEGTGPEVLD